MSAVDVEISTPRLALAARRWGRPGARPVLALHGWLDNAATFDALAPLIDGVDLVALDLPGHGRSAHRAPGAWYHFIDYLSDVAAVLDALDWPRATLLGHSMGAAIASVFAGALPERVDALWLIEGLGPIASEPARLPELLGRAISEREALAAKSLRVFPDLDTAARARAAAGAIDMAAARALVERGTRAVEGGHVWSSDPRLTLASALRLTEDQVLACLAAIRAPTLLVLADPPAPWFTAELMAARCAAVPGLSSVVLPGTHHLHLEDPQPVAAAIAAFRSATGS